MIIRELKLNNFGKFSGKCFEFQQGINLIYGPNEAGKTTISHAIGGMLFGLDRKKGRAARNDIYTICQPWENKTWYEGSMKFETGGKIFCIERNFYQAERSVHFYCETDGEELSVDQGDLQMLLGQADAELFFNTAFVSQMKMKPQETVYDYLENYIAGLLESGECSTDIKKALGILENRKKILEQKQKLHRRQLQQQLDQKEDRIVVLEKEIEKLQQQMEHLAEEKLHQQQNESQKRRGIIYRILEWLYRIFRRKKLMREELERKEQNVRYEEKERVLQEFLGERESAREELLLERENLCLQLHEVPGTDEIAAIDIAMNRIATLTINEKDNILEKLQAKASEVLNRLTNGKYRKLSFSADQEPQVWNGTRSLKLFQISTGCVDQIYLSIRIAMQDLFFEEETMPLIFDDAFVYFDEERLEQLLGYLAKLDRQVLLFTCHKRESDILERLQIPCRKITI